MSSDPLETLRLFGDLRQARLALRGLDTPHAETRARLIRDPAIYKALVDLLFAAEKLVAGPDEDLAFWHPAREGLTSAERRFEKLRAEAGAARGAASPAPGLRLQAEWVPGRPSERRSGCAQDHPLTRLDVRKGENREDTSTSGHRAERKKLPSRAERATEDMPRLARFDNSRKKEIES